MFNRKKNGIKCFQPKKCFWRSLTWKKAALAAFKWKTGRVNGVYPEKQSNNSVWAEKSGVHGLQTERRRR